MSENGSFGVCDTTANIIAYLTGCSAATSVLGNQFILTDTTSGIVILDTTINIDSVALNSLVPGTYYLTATNLDNGCTANDTFNINDTTLNVAPSLAALSAT